MYPVIDYANLAQNSTTAARAIATFKQLQQQYQMITALHHNAVSQLKSITGKDLLGQIKDYSLNNWSPDSWRDALANKGTGSYAQAMSNYDQAQKKNQVLDATNYKAGKTTLLANAYQQQVNVNRASVAAATVAFNQVNQRLQALKSLGNKIGTGQANTLKQAVDLNSRIQLEHALLGVAQLRMQAVLNQQMAAKTSRSIALESAASRFNQGLKTQ